MVDWIEFAGNLLLFALVFGMSATVDMACLLEQIRNRKAILTGIFLQFVVMPLVGFLVVYLLDMGHGMGIMLLVVTSSPGGSYSNWWCSLFNADLALSVTMTAISTMLSVIFLPLNLMVYANVSHGDDVIKNLDWTSLFIALGIVIGAIALGIVCSAKVHSHKFNMMANRLGNFAGIALVIFSALMSNADKDDQLWERPWKFYVGVMLPCLLGLLIATVMATSLRLKKPERVTVSVECCYQNVGIATSVALTATSWPKPWVSPSFTAPWRQSFSPFTVWSRGRRAGPRHPRRLPCGRFWQRRTKCCRPNSERWIRLKCLYQRVTKCKARREVTMERF